MRQVVLVTGATGFIGRSVCDHLRSQGYCVRAATRTGEPVPGCVEHVAISDKSSGEDIEAALTGVKHVVHCAGLAHAEQTYPEHEFFLANAFLARDIAWIAARVITGKFVLISSVSAVSGPYSAHKVSRYTVPQPTNTYGRSKLGGEMAVREAFAHNRHFTILRPTLVYGPSSRGSLLRLFRLASLPVPLPFAGLQAHRSLLDLDALTAAISHSLRSKATDGNAYLVCDQGAIGLDRIVAAFREGLGQRRRLFRIPQFLLALIFFLLGRADEWFRLSRPLEVDCSDFAATGWTPVRDTEARLRAMASQMATANQAETTPIAAGEAASQ